MCSISYGVMALQAVFPSISLTISFLRVLYVMQMNSFGDSKTKWNYEPDKKPRNFSLVR